jgi:cell division protein FtsQ
VKGLKHILVFSLSLVVAGLLLGFAVDRSAQSQCEGFDIEVAGDPTIRFVTQEGLNSFIHEHGHGIEGQFMKDIDTYGIEADLLTIPFVEEAEVYKTIDRKVKVMVRQRVPVLRLFFTDGQSCYVDDKGAFLQLSSDFSHKCLPVTGLSPLSNETLDSGSVFSDEQVSSLWRMAQYIERDEFWSAQIIQVDIDKKKGAVLIPRVGNHQIIMGAAADYQNKLGKLKEFYDKGINQTNWNIYQSLDLRYEGQVVGVKR